MGVSSLCLLNHPHKDIILFKTYENLFGKFPHDKVHGTYRNYHTMENHSIGKGISVGEWAKKCYACFDWTIGAYVLPTALFKTNGDMYSCACFFSPKNLKLGNFL